MKRIFVVDATVYEKTIDDELKKIRIDYFRAKSYVKNKLLGFHILPKQKTFSMGALRIATLLKHAGAEAIYIHMKDFERLLADNRIELPEIVCFSAVCPTVPVCARLAKAIKRIDPKVITMIGGAHINVSMEETRQRYDIFDNCIKGYDVLAVAQILDMPAEKIPMPSQYADFTLLPYDISTYDINIFTTQGCRFKCSYCQDGLNPYFENALDGGLSSLSGRLDKGTLVHYFDSVLGYSENRADRVCKELASLKHEFFLSCDLRAEFINETFIYKLNEAGFREVRIGIETADSEVLAKNNRKLQPEQVIKAAELIRKCSDIYICLYSVTGLPGSTSRSFAATMELFKFLLENRRVDEIKNSLYVPYPNDAVKYEKMGIKIIDKNWENYDRQSYPVYELTDVTADEIWKGYLAVNRTIADAWIKGFGFTSFDQLPKGTYPEYVVGNYIQAEKEKAYENSKLEYMQRSGTALCTSGSL